MTDTLIYLLLGRVHELYYRFDPGYVANWKAYYVVQRINRMRGLPGIFCLDERGHMVFHHNDGRMLHPWTRAYYAAHGRPSNPPEDRADARRCNLHYRRWFGPMRNAVTQPSE